MVRAKWPINWVKTTRRMRNVRYKPKLGTPICHHSKEAYCTYKWYTSFQTFYSKRSSWEIIEMAMPIYDKEWNKHRYQRVYVSIHDLQPYYNKFLENIDFIINAKEI